LPADVRRFKTADSRREKKKSAKICESYPRKSAGKKVEKICSQINADFKPQIGAEKNKSVNISGKKEFSGKYYTITL